MAFSPISTINPNSIGFPNSTNSLTPTSYWGFGIPRATNRTWSNLVVGTGIQTVSTFPYTYHADDGSLNISYNSQPISIAKEFAIPFNPVISVIANQSFTSKKVVSQNLFGCELVYYTSNINQEMRTWFISGQAYTTIKFTNLIPNIKAIGAFIKINGIFGIALNTTNFSGQTFEIEFNNGQIWLLYTSTPVNFNIYNNSGWGILFSSVFNGIVKLAYLGEQSENSTNLNIKRNVYNLYGPNNTYVTGGKIDNTTFSGNIAKFRIDWNKNGSDPLLHLSILHHDQTIQTPNYSGLTIFGIKGLQKGIVGDTWNFTELLTDITFDYLPFNYPDITDIKLALGNDYTFVPNSDLDTYFGFKEFQKLAQIAIVANQLGEYGKKDFAITTLKNKINQWLDRTNGNPMKYDTDYGGFTSSLALGDQGAFFGSGTYNDHHFHYGYILQAAGTVAKFDPTWATTNVIEKINLFARDIINPSKDDPFFPEFRGKDWYCGHGWAAGLAVLGDGNNQESTSEDINAWYGALCWFSAIGNTEMKNIARLSLTLSQRSAQKYWHITDNSIYTKPFSDNLIVGILWSTKAYFGTFFGDNEEYIHGIQMIPFTPISKLSFPNIAYNNSHWNYITNKILSKANVESGWLGLLYKQRALTDPNDAWVKIKNITNFDNGDSKTASLAFISQYRNTTSPQQPIIPFLGAYPVDKHEQINVRTSFIWIAKNTGSLQDFQVSNASDVNFNLPVISKINLISPYYNQDLSLNSNDKLEPNKSYIWRYKDSSNSSANAWTVVGIFKTTGSNLGALSNINGNSYNLKIQP
jgi:endo-1,3(4)-beta-glucanase